MVLITGANGFIGKHLFNFYKNIKKEKVLGFDKNFHMSFLKENENDLVFFDFIKDGKVEFFDRFLSRLKEVENKHLKIYHLSSEVGVNFHNKSTFKSQMIMNSNIYEILLELKHKGFTIDLAFTSSSEVYGEIYNEKDIEKTKDKLLDLSRKPIFKKPERNEYILQKLFAEKMFDNLGLNSFSIHRLFNVFGYGQDSKKGFNAMILDRIYNGKDSDSPLVVSKNSVRTYTPIDETIVKMVEDFESNIGSEYTTVKNIYGKYTINSLDLVKCHLFVAKFIIENDFKDKEYTSIMGALLLKKIDSESDIFDVLLELNYIVDDKKDEIQNRSLFYELSFTGNVSNTVQEFLLELLKYHLLYLHKNYDKDILLHEDSKMDFIGTLINDDEELFSFAIMELDSNPKFKKIIEQIPIRELSKEKVTEVINLFRK